MAGSDARLRLLNRGPPLGGLGAPGHRATGGAGSAGLAVGGRVLLVIGATGVPVALVLAWTALALAFVGWLAEAEGYALPRPGRPPVRRHGRRAAARALPRP